jgi:hypothetical protein
MSQLKAAASMDGLELWARESSHDMGGSAAPTVFWLSLANTSIMLSDATALYYGGSEIDAPKYRAYKTVIQCHNCHRSRSCDVGVFVADNIHAWWGC